MFPWSAAWCKTDRRYRSRAGAHKLYWVSSLEIRFSFLVQTETNCRNKYLLHAIVKFFIHFGYANFGDKFGPTACTFCIRFQCLYLRLNMLQITCTCFVISRHFFTPQKRAGNTTDNVILECTFKNTKTVQNKQKINNTSRHFVNDWTQILWTKYLVANIIVLFKLKIFGLIRWIYRSVRYFRFIHQISPVSSNRVTAVSLTVFLNDASCDLFQTVQLFKGMIQSV